MIAQLQRTPGGNAGEWDERTSADSSPTKGALLRALSDLRQAEERGEIPKREADFLTRYLIALYTMHHLNAAVDKHFGHLFERYNAVFGEEVSD